MNKIGIIFPHQLFSDIELFKSCSIVYLVEEFLFFKQYKFHKQKIAFHRASMKFYENYLKTQGIKVKYINSHEPHADIRALIPQIAKEVLPDMMLYIDPTDNWLQNRIVSTSATAGIELEQIESPLFLNTRADLQTFFREDKKSFFQTTFYKQQRKRLNILIEEGNQPVGGKWTFDSDNRKKYPKNKIAPTLHYPDNNETWSDAVAYVEAHYTKNYGTVSTHPIFPTSYKEAQKWLRQFLDYRFQQFGDYEDAIVKEESFLHHSLLSPLLNVGLLRIDDVLTYSLEFAETQDIPINSTEGFIRQLIGWREFIRGMYDCKGTVSRNHNFFGFTKKIPASFYTGDTGIEPLDDTIKKVLKTGYCHHIERLMILGNFMLLCEFDPDEVYKWFMELFVDAYDWVMVPNVYGMSQFADGGLFATKPYISGSNYIKKMSNYKSGDWTEIWDGLFWRFMHTHNSIFKANPRMSMLLHSWNKMSHDKKENHLSSAENFLHSIDVAS